jgi:hypothetical protein
MVSLDAASGELLWRESDAGATVTQDPATGRIDYDVPVPSLVAVDGHLLEVSRTGVRGLG